MQGKILGYDAASHTGAISGHDGKRYKFVFAEWKSPGTPQKGAVVDFVPDGDNATEIYLVETAVAREGWLSFLFSSDGRVPRKRYWLSYIVPVMAITIIASILDAAMASPDPGSPRGAIFGILTSLFFIWPTFAMSAKRLHDRGFNGWWSAYVNLAAPFAVVVMAGAAYWYYTTKMHAPDVTAPPPNPVAALVMLGITVVLLVSWLYFTIQIGFIKGQDGPNKYGDDPLPTPADVASDRAVTRVFAVLTILFCLIVPFILGSAAYWYYTTKMKPGETEMTAPPPDDSAEPLTPRPDSTPAPSEEPAPAPSSN